MDPRHAKRLHKHTNLTDILIQIEDFFDGLDLYVFANWFKGEIHKGPEIRRYWVDITLLYPYEDMPDPQGGIRLLKHGAKVAFRKELREKALEIESQEDYRAERRGKPQIAEEPVWLVEVSIPRKFIEELDDDDLELIDDESVDTENVSDARDENIDQEDAYQEGDGEEDSADSADDADSEEEEENA